MNTCFVVGAGSFVPDGFNPSEGDFVIAADGGYLALKKLGIPPNLLLGDMDSLPEIPSGVPLLRFPVEKDETDMELALEEGFRRGYRRFALYGAGGGRVDHFLANLQCMGNLARRQAQVWMVCRGYRVLALTDGALQLPPRAPGTLVSVFCHGDAAQGVTLKGLKYPLHNARLTCNHPLGISNEYMAQEAWVEVRQGTLLVVVYEDRLKEQAAASG